MHVTYFKSWAGIIDRELIHSAVRHYGKIEKNDINSAKDSIETYAHGMSKDLTCNREKIKLISIIKQYKK